MMLGADDVTRPAEAEGVPSMKAMERALLGDGARPRSGIKVQGDSSR